MPPFAIKMLAVLGLVCVVVPDSTAWTRKYVYGHPARHPAMNETVFVATRQLQGFPFIKRRTEISYPDEFYLNEELTDVIHGIEIYEWPDELMCESDRQIIGGVGESFATVKFESRRSCGIDVKVTFRVYKAPPIEIMANISDQAS